MFGEDNEKAAYHDETPAKLFKTEYTGRLVGRDCRYNQAVGKQAQ